MIKERPTREELASARATAQRILAEKGKFFTKEYREMFETFLRHTAPISEQEIAHAMVVTSQGEEAAKRENMISFALNTLRNGTQLSAGYIKDVVDYLFGGRTSG